jgi:hypothetical protein
MESLCFGDFAFESFFVYLPPSSSVSSLRRAAAALPAMCCAPAAPALLWAEPRAGSAQLHRLPRAALSSPRRATPPGRLPEPPLAAARRCYKPVPPPASRQPHASLLGRLPPYSSPLPSSTHDTLSVPLPELRRAATRAAGMPALALARPRLIPDPDHLLELLAHSLLRLHTHILLVFACSDHHLSPDLRSASWPPSSATYTTPGPRSSAPRAPP